VPAWRAAASAASARLQQHITATYSDPRVHAKLHDATLMAQVELQDLEQRQQQSSSQAAQAQQGAAAAPYTPRRARLLLGSQLPEASSAAASLQRGVQLGLVLQQALARARRQNTQFAVLFMDLNGFNEINDRLGHAAGDHLLKLVAGRLGASLREVDRLARFGGDEFVILLEPVTQKHEVNIVEEKLLDAMAKPFQLDTQRVEVGLSIGIAMFPGDGTSNEQDIKKRILELNQKHP
jgi:diguanylate cyclase (GGDEF)-like protein